MIEVFLITRDTTIIIESDHSYGSARSKPQLEVSQITSALMAEKCSTQSTFEVQKDGSFLHMLQQLRAKLPGIQSDFNSFLDKMSSQDST